MNKGRAVVKIKKRNGNQTYTCGVINNEINAREMFCLDELIIDDNAINVYDAKDWHYMFNIGKIIHDGKNKKGSLLQELSLIKEVIPYDVVTTVYFDGISKGRYKKLSDYLSLCRNSTVLDFLLSNGAKFRTKLRKPSSMEHLFYNVSYDKEIFCKNIDVLMKHPNSIDKKWIRNNANRIIMCIQKLQEWGITDCNGDNFVRANFLMDLLKNKKVKVIFEKDAWPVV